MNQVVLREGVRGGAILSFCSVALAVLGLTPALRWIPEVPLLGTAIVLPVLLLVWSGWRAASRAGRLVAGALTAALAGALGGCVGGIAYVLAGKPALNIAVGLLGGALVGGALGFVGATLRLRRPA